MEVWLQAVLHIPVNRNHHETVSGKYAEGFVKKRPGGTRVFIGCKQFCVRHCLRWSKRIPTAHCRVTVAFDLIA
uniref:Uncharacterized protein n=1 Tax=Parascaris equorum TaxID=6256 RepID=A0A914R485_PAREQ